MALERRLSSPRPFPALLTKLRGLAGRQGDEWIEREDFKSLCGGPYLRPQHEISQAECLGLLLKGDLEGEEYVTCCFEPVVCVFSLLQLRLIARKQFPAVAERILLDLRHGSSRRRFSTPAISTLDTSECFDPEIPKARRATLGSVPILSEESEEEVVPHRREKTWGCPGEVLEMEVELRQSSKVSKASSSARWKQPDSDSVQGWLSSMVENWGFKRIPWFDLRKR